MQFYDVVMLVVLAGCTAFGFWKGMAWQIASFCSFVVSYFVSLNFCDVLAPHISAETPWNRMAAMLVLYVGSSLVIWMIFRVVASVIDRVKLREFDRQVGALVGLAKGALLCLVITFFAVTLSASGRELILRSKSGHYIAQLIDQADAVMPAGVHEVLGPYLDRLDQELAPVGPGRTNPFNSPAGDPSRGPLETRYVDSRISNSGGSNSGGSTEPSRGRFTTPNVPIYTAPNNYPQGGQNYGSPYSGGGNYGNPASNPNYGNGGNYAPPNGGYLPPGNSNPSGGSRFLTPGNSGNTSNGQLYGPGVPDNLDPYLKMLGDAARRFQQENQRP